MCRVVAYLGQPLLLDVLLYRSDSSLVRQAFDPHLIDLLNLVGWGVAAWSDRTPTPEEPVLYKDTQLPMYDRNLMRLSRKIEAE